MKTNSNINKMSDSCGSRSGKTEQKGFRVISHEIKSMAIAEIEQYTKIPDPGVSSAFHPEVIKTDKGCFCVAGYEKVMEAKVSGAGEIKVELKEISSHSELDIGLRELSGWIEPSNGTPLYAGLIFSVARMYDLMMASDEIMESLIDCGKGTKFTNDREADIKTVLIGRWNRDRDTINAYLNHSKYLNDTTMKKLIEAEAPKVFFEQIQVEKSRTVNLFEKDHLATHEITGKISKLVLGWWKEYIVNKKKIKFSGQGKASASPKTKASGTAEGQSEACAGSPGAAAGDGSDLPGSPGSPEKEKTEHGDMWDLGTSIMEAGIKFVACGEHIKAGLSDAELLVELQGLQTMIEEIEADIDPVLKELDLSLALY